MRKRPPFVFAFLVLSALPIPLHLVSASPEDKQTDLGKAKIEGTWEHTFDNAPGHRQVKVINKTHFIWVTYDRATGIPLVVGGGTWKSDGKTYRETFDFGSHGIPHQLVGKEQVLDVNIEGEEWLVTGTLTNGLRLRETWRRVRR